MLEFVRPLPPDLDVWSKLSPLALKNLVDREFNGLLSNSHRRRQTDEVGICLVGMPLVSMMDDL